MRNADPRIKLRSLLMMLLRALVAAAAVVYVFLALSWKDVVVLPAGFSAPGWPAGQPAGTFHVMASSPDTLLIDHGGLGILALPARMVGDLPSQAQLKPGLHSTLVHARVGLVCLCVVMIACVLPIQGFRWWLLLRCRGLAGPFAAILRLHLIGCFWNCVFPGMTGGDAVKAWQVAKSSGRTADAITSVLVDRILGLIALVALSAGAGAALSADPSHHQLVLRVWGLLLLMGAASVLWLSATVQRFLRLSWLARSLRSRMALAGTVIDALGAYQAHAVVLLWAFLCSCIGHVLIIGGCIVAGRALGMTAPWSMLLALVPIVFLIGALPISLLGLGVMEVAAIALLGGDANQIVGMLAVTRVALLLCALPGGCFIIIGHGQQVADLRAAQRQPA